MNICMQLSFLILQSPCMHAAPPRPSSFFLTYVLYGNHDVNVSLTWSLMAVRVDGFHYTASSGIMSIDNDTSNAAQVVAVPYNTNTTIEIAPFACGIQGESGFFSFVIGEHNNCYNGECMTLY